MVLEDYQHLTDWEKGKEKPARCFSVQSVCIWIKRFSLDLWCTPVENQSSFLDAGDILACRTERKLHFFLSARILKPSLGNFIKKMFSPKILTFFEQSVNQKGRRYVLIFSFLRFFAPTWQLTAWQDKSKSNETRKQENLFSEIKIVISNTWHVAYLHTHSPVE